MEFCKLLTKEDTLYPYLLYLKDNNKLNLIFESEAIYFARFDKAWVGIKLLGIYTSYEQMKKDFNLDKYKCTYKEYESRQTSNFLYEYNEYIKIYSKDLILYGFPSLLRKIEKDKAWHEYKLEQTKENRDYYRNQYEKAYNNALNDVFKKIEENHSKMKNELYKKIKD